jgi:alpha-beta hydrolase superfamily lysophospholipase
MTRPIPVEIPVNGVVLRGERRAGASFCAVLVHDQGEDLDGWLDVPERLSAMGLTVLAFDLRGHGGSDGEADAASMLADIEAVVDACRRGGADLVLVAASGTAAGVALDASSAEAVIAVTPLSISGHPSEGRAHARLVVTSKDRGSVLAAAALQGQPGRRTLVARVPVDAVGLSLLEGPWGGNIASYIEAFVRRLGMELSTRRRVGARQAARREG